MTGDVSKVARRKRGQTLTTVALTSVLAGWCFAPAASGWGHRHWSEIGFAGSFAIGLTSVLNGRGIWASLAAIGAGLVVGVTWADLATTYEHPHQILSVATLPTILNWRELMLLFAGGALGTGCTATFRRLLRRRGSRPAA
jgi:hypothetical protein